LVAIAPEAFAAPGDPKQAPRPQELWNAFPLNPKSERLAPKPGQAPPKAPKRQQAPLKAPFTPPAERQAVAETPPETSSRDFPLLALIVGAGAFVLLALVVLTGARLRHGAAQRRRSAPLWQGTTGIESSPVARLQQYADVEVSLTQPSRFGTGDIESRSGARDRRFRSLSSSDLGGTAERVREVIWNETTAPVLVGSAIAIAAGSLIIYLVG